MSDTSRRKTRIHSVTFTAEHRMARDGRRNPRGGDRGHDGRRGRGGAPGRAIQRRTGAKQISPEKARALVVAEGEVGRVDVALHPVGELLNFPDLPVRVAFGQETYLPRALASA